MSKLPKLKVKWWSLDGEEEGTFDFEQAKDVIFGNRGWAIAFAEGEMVRSYEELLRLAAQDKHKNKEILNITLLVPVVGGG